uniref:Uncharacterized protein n=1 Tax=Pundamilia nyererei TaxID=303518 RepID=A0A3B4F7Q2_9CICH
MNRTVVDLVFMSFLFQPPKATTCARIRESPQLSPLHIAAELRTTAVNINTDVPVIIEYPQDHIIWSLCCFVYSNPCCLGLAALIYSIKVSL